MVLWSSLVIRKDGSAGVATGWIDDISMKRVHEIELDSGPDGVLGTADDTVVYPQTTLTFSEDVNGWTSFKSFIPEAGLSINNKYYTFKKVIELDPNDSRGYTNLAYVKVEMNDYESALEEVNKSIKIGNNCFYLCLLQHKFA